MPNFLVEIGFYPGVLIGVRTYIQESFTHYVIYFPFIEICIAVENSNN
mgnify:CR=1 FL=1